MTRESMLRPRTRPPASPASTNRSHVGRLLVFSTLSPMPKPISRVLTKQVDERRVPEHDGLEDYALPEEAVRDEEPEQRHDVEVAQGEEPVRAPEGEGEGEGQRQPDPPVVRLLAVGAVRRGPCASRPDPRSTRSSRPRSRRRPRRWRSPCPRPSDGPRPSPSRRRRTGPSTRRPRMSPAWCKARAPRARPCTSGLAAASLIALSSESLGYSISAAPGRTSTPPTSPESSATTNSRPRPRGLLVSTTTPDVPRALVARRGLDGRLRVVLGQLAGRSWLFSGDLSFLSSWGPGAKPSGTAAAPAARSQDEQGRTLHDDASSLVPSRAGRAARPRGRRGAGCGRAAVPGPG